MNNISAVINPILTPSIAISPSVNNVCYEVAVRFSSGATNAGTNPIYQWKKNGINVGMNSAEYLDNALNNGDVITCLLTTSYRCAANSTALSNSVSMNITPLSTPSVVVNSSIAAVCPVAPVIYRAVVSSATTSISYQWLKNGSPVGRDTAAFIDNPMTQGDVITCKIIVTGSCLTTTNAVSNSIVTNVFPLPVVKLNHASSLCVGSSRILDAGNFSAYRWSDGSTSRSLQVNGTGTYRVTVTDNNGCTSSDSVSITTLLPKPANFLPGDTSICAYGSLDLIAKYGYRNYVWSNNASANPLTISKPGLYWLDVTDDNSCKGRDTINIALKQCLTGFYIPTAFTPNEDKVNDLFKPLLYGNIIKYSFMIFNRWGQIVYQTSDPTKGWDGNLQGVSQDMNVFAWTCSYQLEGEKQEQRKGTVLLIR